MEMDKYSRDELEPPTWINADFFENVLKISEKSQQIKILEMNIMPGSQKDDHYASVVLRVNIKYLSDAHNKEISLIMKTLPADTESKKYMLLKSSPLFSTEIRMYCDVIPRFHKELQKIGDKTILGAKCYYYSFEPETCIIFEDLRKLGFELFTNRFPEFDELDIILEKVSRWHAVSFKLVKDGDKSIPKFNIGGLNAITDDFKKEFFGTGINNFMQLLSNLPDGKIYYEKFSKIQHTLLDKCAKLYSYRGKCCVLNHGDIHLKNMLSKFNKNKKLEDIILVDFQGCVMGSLALDLIYMMYTLLESEMRFTRWNEIIYIYHQKFVKILKNLGYSGEIPSLIDVQIEFMKCKDFELLMICCILPFITGIISDGEIDINDLVEDTDNQGGFYKHPLYVEQVKRLLPQLLYRGYLED